MKHIFIVNPEAGNGRAEKEFLPKILRALKGTELDYEIHRVIRPMADEKYIKDLCQSGQQLRFYSCGGDGTLNSVLNSIIGFENAQLACIPAGTGNDFVRNFKGEKNFHNIEHQLAGETVMLDVLRFNGRYAINMLNIGMDCTVVAKADERKKKPLLGGVGAYLGGVASVVLSGAHFPLRMEFEGGEILERDFVLLAMANGRFCGGGFQGAPRAKLDDGFFDVCIVKQIRRRKLLSLILKYKTGSHLEDEECRRHILYKQCRRMTVSPAGEDQRLRMAVDGEISEYDTVTVELVPAAICFSIPRGAALQSSHEQEAL